MNKKDLLFICGVLYAAFLLTITFIYGYNAAILHVLKDTQITQEGDIIKFAFDDHEMIYILERR